MSTILAAQQDEAPRLYSKGYVERDAPDMVPVHQCEIHAELEAWARWCWEKWEPKSCESMEGQYDPGEGGRKAKVPVINLPENQRLRTIDSVVRYMRMAMPAHGEALRLFYVGESPLEQEAACRRRGVRIHATRYRPCPWWAVCRAVHIPKATFPGFMARARAALLNILRRRGV